MPESLVVLACLLVVGYLAICLAVAALQRQMIFLAPGPVTPDRVPGAQRESYEHEGLELQGWRLQRPGAGFDGLVVYRGGNAEAIGRSLGELAGIDASELACFDYQGYGGNPGTPGQAELRRETKRLLAVMQERSGMGPERSVLVGRSLGAGVAVDAVAAGAGAAGLVLIAPPPDFARIARRSYPWLPTGLLLRHRFDSLSLAPRLEVPALFLAADADELVTEADVRELHAAWAGPKEMVVLPGVDHDSIHLHPDYLPAINDYLARIARSSVGM